MQQYSSYCCLWCKLLLMSLCRLYVKSRRYQPETTDPSIIKVDLVRQPSRTEIDLDALALAADMDGSTAANDSREPDNNFQARYTMVN